MEIIMVIAVFLGLLVLAAIAAWRTASEWRADVGEWACDVVRPVLTPPVVLPVPRLQQRIVTRVLSEVIVTSRGRASLYSPITVALSQGDLDRIQPVFELLRGEIREEVVEAAKKRKWTIPGELVVQIIEDPTIQDGRPTVFMGARIGSRASDPSDLTAPVSASTAKTRRVMTVLHSDARATEGMNTRHYVDEELVPLDGGLSIHLDDQVRVFTIGRHGCDLNLDLKYISARHAELRRTDAGLVLVDLGSKNGTFVNGKLITQSGLINSDEVKFSPSGPRFLFSRLEATASK